MSLTGWKKPTLEEIHERVKADINSALPGADSNLRHSVLGVLARVLAGTAAEQQLFLDWVADQTNVLYAQGTNLDLWGQIWGITRKQATKATGTATFAANPGKSIMQGVELQSSDGTSFVTTESVFESGGSITIAIEAVEAGSAGNKNAGTQISVVIPVLGITNPGSIQSATGGADIEKDGERGTKDGYRGRIMERIDQAPHGGSKNDYLKWAEENPGVTRAWVESQTLGPNSVKVLFMMDDTYDDGIPLSADVSAVQTYIDDDDRRPITAKVTVVAPIPVPLDITISGLESDTPETRANITAQLRDLIRRRAEPAGTIRLSWLYDAISDAIGEEHHALTSPAADVTHTTNQIATLGAVLYET